LRTCMRRKRFWIRGILAPLIGLSVALWPQAYPKSDRELAESILRNVDADVRKHYYDPNLHGVDWQGRVQEAKRNIANVQSVDAAVSEVAALLDSLHDSHTFLLLPPRTHIHDYGFQMEMFGNRCFVVRVRPGSDAEKKGLNPGDEILAVNEYPISRQNFQRIVYIVNMLRPQPGLRLTLSDVNGHSRPLDVLAKFQLSTVNRYFLHQGVNARFRDEEAARRLLRARYFEKGEDLLIVKIPVFEFSASEVDNILGKMKAHKGVVLDLRGNPGGYEDTLERLLGGIFQNGLKIFDRVGRNSTKSISVTGRHRDAFIGRLAVLVDSESASASELFARVVQLEKRGFIVGDRSSGRVMEANVYPHEVSTDSPYSYGIAVTDADLVMADGKSLEHVGVEPDVLILPTNEDLASKKDPALAKAAGLVGGHLSPEGAGTILPYEESSQFQTTLSLND
jgi:C-terminal processing protease CtpA/Prc